MCEYIESWIDCGVGCVVVGILVVQDLVMVKEMVMCYLDQIFVVIDVYQGRFMIDGWCNVGVLEFEVFVIVYEDVFLLGIIVIDIDVDIGDQDGQLGVIFGVVVVMWYLVVVCGIVYMIDDILCLKYVFNIVGILVGKVLFVKDVDLSEVLEIV